MAVCTRMDRISEDVSGAVAGGTGSRLLTAPDVAARLGVPASWVSKAARADRIPHVRVGRYRRFYWPEIEAWLAKQRRGG